MLSKLFFLAIAVLVLMSMACGLTINLPVDNIQTGPTRTKEIFVEQPDDAEVDLTLAFAAGQLNLSGGAEGAVIEGQAVYNIDDLEPNIVVNNAKIRIETGDRDFKGLPKFGDDIRNEWDLKLGTMPMDLVVNAGAYQGDFDLGGLALKSLEVSDGAADVRLRFSEPNLIEMDMLRYITGASNVRLTGLANANFSSMIFRSGAGDYTLDFSGDLERDADVKIESGISQVTLKIPEGTNAVVYFTGGLANVDVEGTWTMSGNQYTLDGEGPQLTIHVEIGAGNLRLETD